MIVIIISRKKMKFLTLIKNAKKYLLIFVMKKSQWMNQLLKKASIL